jgi:hypothetical protein
MGKPIKLSDRKKEWYLRSRKSEVRRLDALAERERVLIVCEGEKTEPNYFKAIKAELPRHVVEVELHGEGDNTLGLVEKAQVLRDERAGGDYPFDQVWVVFDRDSFPADDFDNAITKAQNDNIKTAWSNEAFELWYVLHFEYRNTAMPRTEYQEKLSTLIGRRYAKNAPDMYQVLAVTGNQASAIKWAQRLHKAVTDNHITPANANPCTTVYQLVEVLNAFKPESPTDT